MREGMPDAEKPTADDPAQAAPPPRAEAPAAAPARKRSGRGRKAARTIAQVASAIRQRDEIVSNVLDLLHQSGFIDKPTHDRVWAVYERGDARTRAMIQELIARVTRVRGEDLEQAADPARFDEEHLSGRALNALEQLPQVDLASVADRARGFDVDDLIALTEGRGRIFEALTQAPVAVNRVRRQLVFVGAAIIVVVGVALLFPDYALYIAFYGLLGVLALVGGLLIKWGWQIGRFAKRYDIDLATLAKLPPEDRALILGRRVWNRFSGSGLVGSVLERRLRTSSSEPPQARRPEPMGPPVPQRPLPIDDDEAGGAGEP